MFSTAALTMRPAAACTVAVRNTLRHASSPLSFTAAKGSLQRSAPSWGVTLGHSHHRFTSTFSTASNARDAFASRSVSSPFRSWTSFSTLSRSSATTSKTMVAAGVAATTVVGPLMWSRTFGSFRSVAHCASGASSGNYGTAPYSASRIPGNSEPIINTKELSFGAAMGLCSGFLFKKLGKMFILVAGLGFVCFQMMGNAGYVKVNWSKVESKFKDRFDLDKDGHVTVQDGKRGFQWIINLLTNNFQFKSTFAAGFVLGFRYG